MPDHIAGLVGSLVAATLIFVISVLIRVRGPVGLVKNVDWNRVSDTQGLGQFVSLIMSLMAALIAAHGVMLYAFHGDRALRNIGTVAFVILIALCTLALMLGQLRYQDKPSEGRRRDGR